MLSRLRFDCAHSFKSKTFKICNYSPPPFAVGDPGKVAFPDSNHPPTLPAKKAVHVTISPLVRFNLLNPKLDVRFGQPAMRRVAMPETPIDKNGNAFLRKHKVRFPLQREIAAPARNAFPTHQRDELEFR